MTQTKREPSRPEGSLHATPSLQLLLILLAAVAAFLVFHERSVSGHDPANFVLALRYGYDVFDKRPHAPGYPGFILLWHLTEFVAHCGPHAAILLTNLFFSLVAIVLTFAGVCRMFDSKIAIAATLLVLVNPLFLYYENVGEIYSYDAAFSALLVYLLLAKPRRVELALFVVYGLLGSFRLSSFILTLPVVAIVQVVRVWRGDIPWARALHIAVAVVLGALAWFIPYVIYVGGLSRFAEIFGAATALSGTLSQNLSTFLVYTIWMLNAGLLYLVMKLRGIGARLRTLDERYVVLLLLIVIPALFFALKYYEKGYALIYIVPLSTLLAIMTLSFKRGGIALTAYALVSVLCFCCVPFVPPSSVASLNYEHRSSSERMQSAVLRATSFYAPTLAHIRASDESIEQANALLRLPDSSVVFLNNAAALWAYPRSIQVAHPELHLVMAIPGDSLGVHHFVGSHADFRHAWTDFLEGDSVYYLSVRDLDMQAGLPPGRAVGDGGRLRLYVIERPHFADFHRYVTQLFFRGS